MHLSEGEPSSERGSFVSVPLDSATVKLRREAWPLLLGLKRLDPEMALEIDKISRINPDTFENSRQFMASLARIGRLQRSCSE